jgi:hypothetical protein
VPESFCWRRASQNAVYVTVTYGRCSSPSLSSGKRDNSMSADEYDTRSSDCSTREVQAQTLVRVKNRNQVCAGGLQRWDGACQQRSGRHQRAHLADSNNRTPTISIRMIAATSVKQKGLVHDSLYRLSERVPSFASRVRSFVVISGRCHRQQRARRR